MRHHQQSEKIGQEWIYKDSFVTIQIASPANFLTLCINKNPDSFTSAYLSHYNIVMFIHKVFGKKRECPKGWAKHPLTTENTEFTEIFKRFSPCSPPAPNHRGGVCAPW